MRKRKEITEKGNKRKRKEVKGNDGEIGGGGMKEEDGGGKSKSEERVRENEGDGGGNVRAQGRGQGFRQRLGKETIAENKGNSKALPRICQPRSRSAMRIASRRRERAAAAAVARRTHGDSPSWPWT